MSIIGNILWIICGGWLTALLWCVFGALFVLILLFGAYGIGYDASQFIYNQF